MSKIPVTKMETREAVVIMRLSVLHCLKAKFPTA